MNWWEDKKWIVRVERDLYEVVFGADAWTLWPSLHPLVMSMWKDGKADYYDAVTEGSDADLWNSPPAERAAHMLVRYECRPAQLDTTGGLMPRLVAFVGCKENIAPFLTSTVIALLRPSRVHLPIVADALQDAGMPETHPLLARCRDESVPFCRGEWVHREAMRIKS